MKQEFISESTIFSDRIKQHLPFTIASNQTVVLTQKHQFFDLMLTCPWKNLLSVAH